MVFPTLLLGAVLVCWTQSQVWVIVGIMAVLKVVLLSRAAYLRIRSAILAGSDLQPERTRERAALHANQ
jgi:hypothetical protein